CNDGDANIYPGVVETANDGIDQDCSGADLAVEARVDQGPSGDQRFPWVDYNESTNEYLAVWQDKRNGNDDIYASRMDRSGNKIGSDIAVSTASGHQQRVLVKAGGGGYLALWHDLRNQATNGADIYGAWIAGDGTVGPEMAICACASDQWNPVAGYDPVSDTFLVVFLDARGSTNNQTGNVNDNFDLYGAVIPAGGSGSVTNFPVVSAINGQRGPQIGYDHGNAHYYMAWNDRRGGLSVGYDIYGSRVTTSGVLMDGSGVLLAGASGNQFRPMVTDRRPASVVNNHLIAWTDYRNGTQADVYGVYVDGSGLIVGSDIAISTNGSEQANVVGDLDWINTKKNLVGYITQGMSSDYEIQNAWVDQAGAAVGDYTIAGVSTGAANEQRAQVVSYATDGAANYGFLAVWSDKRNGT
ncbi:MAG: putative metal-binding motif-containing protein, partial [Nitrospirota bacterium]|nr:putative metal-binding motif-containing protein [Nitrospirota bacterium]